MERDILLNSFSVLNFPGIIAIDISGTKIFTALTGFLSNNTIKHEDLYSTPIHFYDKSSYPNFDNYLSEIFIPDIIKALKASIKRLDSLYPGSKLPIGISFAGQISTDGDIYSSSPIFGSSKCIHPINIKDEIHKDQNLKDYEIYVLNDISASAWRFSIDPEIEKLSRYLVLYLGAGLGSKILTTYKEKSFYNSSKNEIKKEVILDQKGFAGEMGHIRVVRPDFIKTPTPCECGNADHLASYILPQGVFKLFEYFKKQYIIKYPDQELDFNAVNYRNIHEYIAEFFKDITKIELAKKIIDTIVKMFSSIIANNILSIGFEKVILTGSVLYQWGKNTTYYFIEALTKNISDDLNGYSKIDDSFIIEKVFNYPRIVNYNDFERADRFNCLEGVLVYIEDYYKTHYQVTVGNFNISTNNRMRAYQSFKLACANDIEYPILTNDNIFHKLDNLLNDITQNRKLLFVIDRYYNDIIKNNDLSNKIDLYFTNKNRKVASEKTEFHATFIDYDVIIKSIDSFVEINSYRKEYKTIDSVIKIIEWAYKSKLPRDGIIVAVGGGVVLDTVGFAASQFRRMVDYIRIPTTLIGQMDAGIGVKVGVNFSDAKNLIGAFYPPLYVINDVNFLFDLNSDQLSCGISEILKMGIISQADIFITLEENAKRSVEITGKELEKNINIKNIIIKLRDESIRAMLIELQKNLAERDLRRLVDFGHLFSPVIESVSDYRVPHGFAVAIDMYISFNIALNIKKDGSSETLILFDLYDRFLTVIKHFNLLYYPKIDYEYLFIKNEEIIFEESIAKTIGHRGGDLNMVLPFNSIGKAGFINLDNCLNHDGYLAIITKDELKANYHNALESLKRDGRQREF